MGLTEILTTVFIVLKLCEIITWSWWLVLLPEIIAVALYLMISITCVIIPAIGISAGTRAIEKHIKKTQVTTDRSNSRSFILPKERREP